MLILFILFLIYCYIETRRIRIVRQEIIFDKLDQKLDGLRLLHLSDFHINRLNRYHRKVAGLLRDIDVDVAVFTGDYKLNFRIPDSRPVAALKYIVDRIKAPLGIFGILGNKEDGDFVPYAESAGISILKDRVIKLEHKGAGFWIVGMNNVHPHRQSPPLDELLAEVDKSEFTILLAHSPDYVPMMKGRKIDLFLAGDTHGGQIMFPIIGPLKVKSKVSRRYARGMLQENGTIAYINSGIGWSGIAARFMCRPEISVIVLRQERR